MKLIRMYRSGPRMKILPLVHTFISAQPLIVMALETIPAAKSNLFPSLNPSLGKEGSGQILAPWITRIIGN